ncbi:PP2C family protein-serine/threonine phosphatase [Spirillospora sp. CA-294931]|uniref:PP2C family protein-serine/threonine phosphatase n=1 Tax=Spirillospora sp. CA-294931 TaxID=3240042 RepID=UPI003D8F0DF0
MTATFDRGNDQLLAGDGPLRLLLVEDDPGDALLVEELLLDAGPDVEISLVRTLRDALEAARTGPHCILVDLSLPDAHGLAALREVLAAAPRAAVLVLTGLDDAHVGVAAVAAGAQDYLVKQDVDGALLSRAIRYAIERRRADESERQLVEARAVSRENARLERGLLPIPVLADPALGHHARYRPGRHRALLGGDFHDTVQTADGSVHLVIGDVSGHGADEASLGVRLRMAWRTLILAGSTGQALLETLDTVLLHERWSEEIFTTLCMCAIAPDRRGARVWRAGHPPPLVFDRSGVTPMPEDPCGPALGLLPGARWAAADLAFEDEWALMLYTDGLIEGFCGKGSERLDLPGLLALAEDAHGGGRRGQALVDALIDEAERLNDDVLADDLAVLMVTHGSGS